MCMGLDPKSQMSKWLLGPQKPNVDNDKSEFNLLLSPDPILTVLPALSLANVTSAWVCWRYLNVGG